MAQIFERACALPCFKNPTDVSLLGGGITNVNLYVADMGLEYVVRLGADIPEHGVMRWNELILSRAAHALGIAPKVVYHEPGVLVLEFLKARTFSEEDVRSAENLPRIISLISKIHRRLGSYLTEPVLAFWPYQVNQAYVKRLLAENSRYAAKLTELIAEQNKLIAAIGPVDLVIGHNDLLAANILDDETQLWLIDWEYGGYNTPLFDLAGLASNSGMTELQEHDMLSNYFQADVEIYWRPYRAMKCVSLMRETLWSMTSELHSEIDFDYASYTADNLVRFNTALADFDNT